MHHTARAAAFGSPWALAAKLSTLLLAGALVLGVACGGDSGSSAATLSDPDQTGFQLTNQFISLLKDKDTKGLTSFLSDAFIIQRADGSYHQKATYLQNLPEIGDYTISDVSALQAGDALTVRWVLTVNETINGQRYAGDPAPRLSTFVYDDGEWRLSSHANFNAPEASTATPPTGN